MYYDYHMHSNFSGDSQTPMEDMVKKSIDIGLKEICFTDHVDYDIISDVEFETDYDAYFKKINMLKDKYKNKITIKKDGEVLANIPINVGALGFLATPLWSTVGITAAILTRHTIEITKKDGEVIDLKQASEETFDRAKSSYTKDDKGSNEAQEENNDDDNIDFN